MTPLALALLACTGAPPEPPPPKEAPAAAEAPPPSGPRLLLDGQEIAVRWGDGDTFSYEVPGQKDRVKARLAGFNTLESYGPVHRWGEWRPEELHALAKAAGVRAEGQVWRCQDTGEGGGYGRKLVDCPDLRRALLVEGLAHAFAVEGEASAEDLAAQAEGIARRAGMWAKGVPEGLVTSLHSASEVTDGGAPYDRVASTATGQAQKREHNSSYETCQEVCHAGSCMIYVPYAQRYGDARAACLQGDPAPGEEP